MNLCPRIDNTPKKPTLKSEEGREEKKSSRSVFLDSQKTEEIVTVLQKEHVPLIS